MTDAAAEAARRLGVLDGALVVGYLAALVLLGWMRARRGRGEAAATEFLLAGRTLTLPGFVATLVSTWYGGVLGVGEYSYRYGLSNWIALGGPYYVAGLLFALLFASRARRADLVTVPERLLRDHGPAVATLGAAVVLVNTLPAAYLLMLGVLLRRSFGMSLAAGVLLAGGFSMLVVLGSGFRAVVRTNALQFALMYGGFLLVLPFAWREAGGLGALATLPPECLSWDGGLGVQAVLVWYVIALQTLVEPTFYQRCFAARTPAVARRGVLVSVAFWVVFDGLTTLTGMFARVLVPGLEHPVEAYPALADQVLPPVARGAFYVGMLATVMSTVESYLFVGATTLGFDLPLLARAWRRGWSGQQAIARFRREAPARRATRIGLALVTAAAVGLAIVAPTVIGLWKAVGSIVTPALLLPLAGGFLPRLRAGPRATLVSMIASAGLAAAFVLAGAVRGGGPVLGIEPIFPALAVSIACHAPAWLRRDAIARDVANWDERAGEPDR
ncbi:MAG: sodium:solute symporter family protein [Acidobacteria bacterium]|nr:MAG: sodium:solute symporter family protein [Acidobacteriota bacterium]